MKIDSISVTQPKRIEPIKSSVERGDISKEHLNNQQMKKEDLKSSQTQKEEFEKTELEKAIELVNDALKMADKKFDFELHEGTNRTTVKVINRETDEVIREIPPKEILDLVEKMTQLVGLLMDKRV